MYAKIKALAAVVAVAAAAACSDSASSPTASFAEPQAGASFARTPAPSDGSTLGITYTRSYTARGEQTATGGTGVIDFTGAVTLPNPCYNVSAAHTSSGGTIVVTVTALDNGNTCQQVLQYNNYTGQVAGLAPGTYDFSVVHQVDNRSSTAYQATITVQ